MVVPKEAEIVRRDFRRYLEPVAVAVAKLIEAGVKTEGQQLGMASVIRLLQPHLHRKLTYKDEVVEGERKASSIKLWEASEVPWAQSPETSAGRRSTAPLRGLLFCGHCDGDALLQDQSRERYVYYECVRDKKRVSTPARFTSRRDGRDIVLERLSILRTGACLGSRDDGA